MEYTKASEKDKTVWSLSEFISLHGNFGIIQEYASKAICGRFNNRGVWTQVHVEKKIRNTSISEILNNQNMYEVVVCIDEYCLYKKGTIIDYNAIWEDSNLYEIDYRNLDISEYFSENSDIFDGKVL